MSGYNFNGTNRTTNCTSIKYEDFLIEEFSHEPTSVRTKVVAVAYGFICLVGLTANVTLMGSLLTGKKRSTVSRAPSTILIFNLAIADTMLLLTLPFAIVHRLSNRWIFGNFFCKTEEVLKFMSFYASVFFITAMAVDRGFEPLTKVLSSRLTAVELLLVTYSMHCVLLNGELSLKYCILCRPTQYNRRRARLSLWIISMIIWCLALLIDIPIMLYARVDSFGFCNVNFPGNEMISLESMEYLHSLDDNEEFSNYYMDCIEDITDYFEYYGEDITESFEKGDHGDIFMEYCSHPPFKGLHIWLTSNFVIGFVFPFAIITACYVNIMRLKSSMTPASGHNGRRDSLLDGDDASKIIKVPGENTKRKKEKILTFNSRAKMIMGVLIPCLILAFLLCWLPYHTWHLIQIKGIHVDLTTCGAIRDITFCLAFSNSALNPILNSFFLFNNKERLRRLSAWLQKVTHLGRSSSYSTIRVRYTSTRSNETGQDSKSLPDVTLVLQ